MSQKFDPKSLEPGEVSRGRGGLFRRFILPQILIVGAAGLVGLLWEASYQRKLDRERLGQMTLTNAMFLDRVKVPRSKHTAENLSAITGARVGFFLPGDGLVGGDAWSGEEREIARLAKQREPGAVRRQGLQAMSKPIADGRGSIVVVEPTRPLLALSNRSSLLPLLGMGAVAVAAAFLIARTVVVPLQTLAGAIFAGATDRELRLPGGLTRRHDEIGTLARTLVSERSALLEEQRRRRDAEKMALLGQLSTSLAHEIKNPTAAIIMHAQTLEARGDVPEAGLIREEGEHITSLVNQWMYVARPEAPRTSRTDLVPMLRSLENRLRPLLAHTRCSLELRTPERLEVDCDCRRLEQAFRNLIDNAVKAMARGGSAVLEISRGGEDGVEFTLTDEGAGFSEEALARFGETFYSEREGGMGLGLALAKGVIESHGGRLSARNLPDGGACVEGTLCSPAPTDPC